MAADFSAVRAYITAQIAALSSVVSCDDTAPEKRVDYPAVFIGWGDVTNKGEMNAKKQRAITPFTVEIIGSSADQVEQAMEDIGDLFTTAAQVSALGALNVSWVLLRNKYYPLHRSGDNDMRGYLELELMHERST